jgi:hypothetical protein
MRPWEFRVPLRGLNESVAANPEQERVTEAGIDLARFQIFYL